MANFMEDKLRYLERLLSKYFLALKEDHFAYGAVESSPRVSLDNVDEYGLETYATFLPCPSRRCLKLILKPSRSVIRTSNRGAAKRVWGHLKSLPYSY
jgi:hypothetical protein